MLDWVFLYEITWPGLCVYAGISELGEQLRIGYEEDCLIW